MLKLNIFTVFFLVFFLSSFNVYAQTSCRYDAFGNYVCSDGGGYRKDAFGNWQGTGNKYGGGWRRDALGNDQGTGSNYGTSCRWDALGVYRCNK